MFKKLKQVIHDQLTMGATPEKLSQSVIFGFIIGVFPFLGTTTVLSMIAAFIFKLNHVVIQTTNYLTYPLQLLMIPVYIKIVSLVFDVGNIPIRPDLIMGEFMQAPMNALKKYGIVGFYAVLLWIAVAPIVYFSLQPVLVPVVRKLKGSKKYE